MNKPTALYKNAFLCVCIGALFFIQCTEKKENPAATQFLAEINQAIDDFEEKADIIKARSLIIDSVNKNSVDKDSIVLVESLDQHGAYQCVAYTSHNQMITFYNAKKGSEYDADFVQASGQQTPYEALSFLDAIQNDNFDQFYDERNKEEVVRLKAWVVSFISREDGEYNIKSYLSK